MERVAKSERCCPALVAAIAIAAAIFGCGNPPDANRLFEDIADARRSTAELLVSFTKAADAANRAVMSVAEEPARTAAAEAREGFAAVEKEVGALAPLLARLRYDKEAGLLQRFTEQFQEYRTLEEEILELAVENSNAKASRLAFGPAEEAVGVLGAALDGLVAARELDQWRVRSHAATAIAEVRHIQVLQAPHIAEPTDAVMTGLEEKMARSEQAARLALTGLRAIVTPASRPRLDEAAAALERFLTVHREILALSRRNTNVRSLALSLNRKRALLAPCEESLRTLQAELASRHRGR
jgi:hypothetical protein